VTFPWSKPCNKCHSFPPIKYCHKKRLCPAGKYDFNSPRAICFPNCEGENVIAWPKRGKNTQGKLGKEYYIFSPSWIFVLFFSLTIIVVFGHRMRIRILLYSSLTPSRGQKKQCCGSGSGIRCFLTPGPGSRRPQNIRIRIRIRIRNTSILTRGNFFGYTVNRTKNRQYCAFLTYFITFLI
jgi:hypothetical protein